MNRVKDNATPLPKLTVGPHASKAARPAARQGAPPWMRALHVNPTKPTTTRHTTHHVQERVGAAPCELRVTPLTLHSITSGAKSKVKSSAQRAIRSKVLEEYPKLEPYIEDILPKKEQLELVKLCVILHSASLFPHTHSCRIIKLTDVI